VKLASDAGEAELQTAKEDSMANLEARKEEVAKKVAQAVEAAEAMKTEDTALVSRLIVNKQVHLISSYV